MLDNTKMYLHKWWLTFSDNEEEKAYDEKTSFFASAIVRNIAFSCLLVNIVLIIITTFIAKSITTTNIISLVVLIIYLPIAQYIPKRFQNWSKYFVFATCICFSFLEEWIASNIIKNVQNWGQLEVVVFSSAETLLQWLQDLNTFSYTKYYLQIISYVAFKIYFLKLNFLACDSDYCVLWRNGSIAREIALLIVQGLTAYYTEKYKRDQYHEIHTQKTQLSQFKNYVNSVVDVPIIIWNMKEGEEIDVHFYNQAAALIFGESKEEIERNLEFLAIDNSFYANEKLKIGRQDHPYILIQNQALIMEQIRSNRQNKENLFGHSVSVSYTKKPADKIYYLEISIDKFEQEGVNCIAYCFHDFGAFKDLNDYKSKLLASVSHNLITPLSVVTANLEIAYEKENQKEIKKLLKIAKSSCFLLLCAINDLLDYSQINIGKIQINFNFHKIGEIVDELLKNIKLQSKLKGLDFIFNMKIENNLCLQTDQQRLTQILVNILHNAIKFTSKGKVTFSIYQLMENAPLQRMIRPSLNLSPNSISLPNENSKSEQIVFEIEDTGVGIKSENLNKLFKINNQQGTIADSSFNIQGIGLGLTVSHELIKLLNRQDNFSQQIFAESKENIGSKFSILLTLSSNDITNEEVRVPEFAQSGPKCAFESKEKKIKPQNLKALKILSVDDESFCQNVIKLQLNEFEIEGVEFAANGCEAIEIIEANARKYLFFDIICMDCNMPLMNGFEATRKIVKMIEKIDIKPLFIIALTANIETADEKSCYEAGMRFYLKKPVKKNEFKKVLLKILNLLNGGIFVK